MEIDRSIIARIQKALALARDRDDHESQTAMLLAQRLMVKHGLSMAQVEEQEEGSKKEVNREVALEPEKKVWWKETLSQIIAQNFRCHLYNLTYGNGQRAIVFLGLKEDTEIAKDVFQFATEQMEYHAKEYIQKRKKEAESRVKEWHESPTYLTLTNRSTRDLEQLLRSAVLKSGGSQKQKDYFELLRGKDDYSTPEYRKRLLQMYEQLLGYKIDTTLTKNEYMQGFLIGLQDQFKKQVEKEKWGLILVKDALVEQTYKEMTFAKKTHRSSVAKRHGDDLARQAGYTKGKNFSGGTKNRIT